MGVRKVVVFHTPLSHMHENSQVPFVRHLYSCVKIWCRSVEPFERETRTNEQTNNYSIIQLFKNEMAYFNMTRTIARASHALLI